MINSKLGLVHTQYTSIEVVEVFETQTDRQTDRQTDTLSNTHS
jgi:hypothetical protein